MKVWLLNLTFSLIFVYLYKKTSNENGQVTSFSFKALCILLTVINVSNLVSGVLEIVEETSNGVFSSIPPYIYTGSTVLNVPVLLFLFIIIKMIRKLREQAINNFKFNPKTKDHFLKN